MEEKLILFSKLILKSIVIALIFLVYIFIWLFCLSYDTSVYAAESGVLSDLMHDVDFNVEDYPSVNNDYSLKVIQLAESNKNTLVVYVYQPSHYTKDLTASHISIYYGFSQNGSNLDATMYELELLSTEGVFDKYLVKGFDVKPDDIHRYYNILSIYRKFDIDIDDLNEGLVDKKKAYGVGQQWYCTTINDVVHYEMCTFSYMDVESIFSGFQHLSDGFTFNDLWLKDNDCYAWFYIFNPQNILNNGTTKSVNVKHIYDAKLRYDIRTVRELRANGGKNFTYGQWEKNKEVVLSDTDVMSWQGDGILSKKYEWNRIMSCNAYKKFLENNNVDISDELNSYLSNDYYVFSFLETDYMEDWGNVICLDYSEVVNTTLLRLHFLDTSGNVYDLGVVSDMISADNIADGYGGTKLDDLFDSLGEWFEKLFAILGIVILVIVLVAISGFITPLWKIICLLFKALWYVISFPFRLIAWAFKRGN